MSTISFPVAVLLHANLSHGARLLYGVLLMRAAGLGSTDVPLDDLVSDLRTAPQSIVRWRTELAAAGLIRFDGTRQVLRYHLTEL